MTDYIVSKYNFLDYDALVNMYGSYEKALIAIDSNAGAEYDLKDDSGNHSYYKKLLLKFQVVFPDRMKLHVEMLSPEQMVQYRRVISETEAIPEYYIRKFLHLDAGS